MGKAVLKHKMQIMYPLCGRFTQVRHARGITATDTTIPVWRRGVIQRALFASRASIALCTGCDCNTIRHCEVASK